MTSANTPNSFYDVDQLQADLQRVLPSPDDPIFIDNFQMMARVMAEHLLSKRANTDTPVLYEDLAQSMALSKLLKLVDGYLVSGESGGTIQTYIECISRCSWDEIQQSGIPAVAWMNHNFCYGSFLELVKN